MKLGKYNALFFLMSLSCGSWGCGPARNTQAEIEAGCPGLRGWDPSAAVEDAKLAAEHGDLSLLGTMGVALEVPGGYDVDVVRNKHKIVIMQGTTDAIRNQTCRVMNDRAFEYAEKYNTTIIGQ